MASIVEAVLLASAARTTTQTVDPIGTNLTIANGGPSEYLEVVMNTTVASAGSVTLSIQEYLEANAAWVTRLASGAVTTVIVTRLVLGIAVPTLANATATGIVPPRWRVVCTANNANTQTYSVTARVFSGC